MTPPGPAQLGRGAVVAPGVEAPGWLSAAERMTVDEALLADADRLEETVNEMHLRWVGRCPSLVELAIADTQLREPEKEVRAPWEVGADHTFLRERLHFLLWANNYDARGPDPIWWWARKAARLGATAAGPADVVLPDGVPAWIDAGPRHPLGDVGRVVAADTVRLGRLTPQPTTDRPPPPGLAPDQIEAVTHNRGPARIIAPAGSGKTRVLVARLRHLTESRRIEPELICAVAYNARAAAEMRQRVGDSRVSVRTIHSLGWEILQHARGNLTLLDEHDMRRRLDPLVQVPRRPNTDVVGPYLEAVGEARIALRPPAEVEAARDDVPDLPRILERYRDGLFRRGEADHDEQIFGAIEALLADPELRGHWQGRCRHLLVDEFQDLTPAYLLLLRLVASPELDVFGVGDDDQTIYGYAGADPGFLIDFERRFPGAEGHSLEVNYRCPQPVVEGINRLLDHNGRRISKHVTPGPGVDTEAGALRLERSRGLELALRCADLVTGWLEEGTDPRSIAVLARVNSALLPIHTTFADVGIPFYSPLSPDLLQRTVLRATLAWIRIALDPDRISRRDLMEAVRRPSRGLTGLTREMVGNRAAIGLEELEALRGEMDVRRSDRWNRFCLDIRSAARAARSGDSRKLLRTLIDTIGLARAASALDTGRSRADRAAQSDDLVALERAAAGHPPLVDFETWLQGSLTQSGDADGVRVTTIHRVKGMEWDRVVLFGADEGLLPHDLSSDIEEERRVFHVALTRGRQRVVALADEKRPSRFVAEMEGSAPPPTGPPARRPAAVEVAVGERVMVSGGYTGTVVEVTAVGVRVEVQPRGRLEVRWGETVTGPSGTGPLTAPTGDRTDVDQDLLGALKAWRLKISRERGIPAFVVFHDRTLEELAALRPGSEEALARVRGLGPAKLDAYGDDLLAVISESLDRS